MNLKSVRDTLPNKLSDLLDVALKDLVKVERSSRYKVEMCNWYYKEPKEPCEVCLAGAALAKSVLNEPPSLELDSIEPAEMRKSIARKMYALDNLRCGNVTQAYANLKGKDVYNLGGRIECRLEKLACIPVGYSENPSKFKKQMRTLRDDLRAEGF